MLTLVGAILFQWNWRTGVSQQDLLMIYLEEQDVSILVFALGYSFGSIEPTVITSSEYKFLRLLSGRSYSIFNQYT